MKQSKSKIKGRKNSIDLDNFDSQPGVHRSISIPGNDIDKLRKALEKKGNDTSFFDRNESAICTIKGVKVMISPGSN